MTRKILKIGSSMGITIPKSLIDKLGLKAGQKIEVREDNDSSGFYVGVSETDSNRDDRIAKRTMNFIDRYRSDLEALADR